MASSSSSPELKEGYLSNDFQRPFSYKEASHGEVLEDLLSRFILNLPDEELSSIERVSFQVEQAHWFYEDFIREENPRLQSLPLKKFSAMLFDACPLLHRWRDNHDQNFNSFMLYKTRVPVCGAVMLNSTWDKCLLVKGWKSSSGWGFPKGKINEDELPTNCAIREVLEETGYNLSGQINPDDVIEMTIKEQKIVLFVVSGVPEDFPFKTKTRKEISKIEWFKLSELPTGKRGKVSSGKFYLITPFLGALKAFIHDRKPRTVAVRESKPATSNTATSTIVTQNHSSNSSPFQPIQDTSSSSSAENGSPHTPQQIPAQTHPPAIGGDSAVLDSYPIDPHFARLLNSLALSDPSRKTQDKLQPDLQARAPASPLPSPSVKDPSPFEEPNESSLPPQVAPPRAVSRSSSVARSSVSPAPLTNSVSDKHSKYLSLLQSVADESSRMTPRITANSPSITHDVHRQLLPPSTSTAPVVDGLLYHTPIRAPPPLGYPIPGIARPSTGHPVLRAPSDAAFAASQQRALQSLMMPNNSFVPKNPSYPPSNIVYSPQFYSSPYPQRPGIGFAPAPVSAAPLSQPFMPRAAPAAQTGNPLLTILNGHRVNHL